MLYVYYCTFIVYVYYYTYVYIYFTILGFKYDFLNCVRVLYVCHAMLYHDNYGSSTTSNKTQDIRKEHLNAYLVPKISYKLVYLEND